MGLYDRVSEKRKQHKQHQRDVKQDEEIKQLRKDIDDAEQRGKQRALKEKEKDDVGGNLGMSGAMIQRQFDEGFERLGRRFAVGDGTHAPPSLPLISPSEKKMNGKLTNVAQTENALQAQIIALQQTVIRILQDALENSRPLSRADQAKLIAASNAAREGSLEALRQQQLRLGAPSSPQRALPAPKRASSIVDTTPLFCCYSLDLQYASHKPLNGAFARNAQCPDCGSRLDVSPDDVWAIAKCTDVVVLENGVERDVTQTREFHLGQRFVVKCHTPDGQYACVLCSRHRERDAVCRSVEALANHVGRFHDVGELELDPDLRERGLVKGRLGFGSASASPVPSLAGTREVVEVGRGYR